jgi:hypothetical protein
MRIRFIKRILWKLEFWDTISIQWWNKMLTQERSLVTHTSETWNSTKLHCIKNSDTNVVCRTGPQAAQQQRDQASILSRYMDFSLLQAVQTDSKAHYASWRTNSLATFISSKLNFEEADCSPNSLFWYTFAIDCNQIPVLVQTELMQLQNSHSERYCHREK